MTLTKKDPRGRPRIFGKRKPVTLRLPPEMVQAIEEFRGALDPSLSMTRMVELLIRHCKREKDAGKLQPVDLFGKDGGD